MLFYCLFVDETYVMSSVKIRCFSAVIYIYFFIMSHIARKRLFSVHTWFLSKGTCLVVRLLLAYCCHGSYIMSIDSKRK